MMVIPTSRTIRHALSVLERLPLEALADVTERLIDRMDAAEALDLDLEPDDFDACRAEDMPPPGHLGVGDADDAEMNGDEDEPDSDDEPDFDGEFDDDPAMEKAWLLAAAERALIRPEPCRQLGAVQGRRHGVDGVWVAVP